MNSDEAAPAFEDIAGASFFRRRGLLVFFVASLLVLEGEPQLWQVASSLHLGRSPPLTTAAPAGGGPRFDAALFRNFATRDFTWSRLRNGSEAELSLSIHGCTRPSREAALEGLHDAHLLFMGDSLMRFQYVNLAYFLETGRPHNSGPPHNEIPREWGAPDDSIAAHWLGFFQGTSARLGTEICDCFRPGLENGLETRFYFGANGVRLTYVQFFPQEFPHSPGRLNVPVVGHDAFAIGINTTCARSRTCKMDPHLCSAPGLCSVTPHWAEDDAVAAITTVSRLYQPDLLVLNSYGWQPWDSPFYHELLLAAFDAVARESPGQAQIWKAGVLNRREFSATVNGSRVPSIDRGIREVLDNQAKKGANVGFLDADALVSSIDGLDADEVFSDQMHLRPGVNDALNYLLLCIILP